MQVRKQKAHDRRASDLPMNARVAIAEVEDPLGLIEGATSAPAARGDREAAGAPEWRVPDRPKIIVVRSIRTDPIAWMVAHKRLSESKYRAARYWQQLHARSAVGSIQSVDTTKEPVDGGRPPEMLSDAQKNAILMLRSVDKKLDKELGELARLIVHDVLAVEMFVTQSAEMRGIHRQRAYRIFQKALDVLAVEFGFATSGSHRKVRQTHRKSLDKVRLSC